MILNNKTFEKLFVWDESKELFISFYKKFKNNNFKDYFYKDQLFRATLSISNNIAEWYERISDKQLIMFLSIAKWSAWEVRNILLIWKELWYFTEQEFNIYIHSLIKISVWLQNLIKIKN